MQNYKANPTRFNGVLFRSKSEAIFAAALNEMPNAIWQYEPVLSGFASSIDFMVIGTDHLAEVWVSLVEYKPSLPTDDYIERRCAEYQKYLSSKDWSAAICKRFSIVYGSPWKDDRSLAEIVCDELIGRYRSSSSLASYLQPHFESARFHRFDLAPG